MKFSNFYWLESPMPGVDPVRVTVRHQGQEQQCSNCLLSEVHCKASGVGKQCRDKFKTPRKTQFQYMKEFKQTHNYKTQREKAEEAYPSLPSKLTPAAREKASLEQKIQDLTKQLKEEKTRSNLLREEKEKSDNVIKEHSEIASAANIHEAKLESVKDVASDALKILDEVLVGFSTNENSSPMVMHKIVEVRALFTPEEATEQDLRESLMDQELLSRNPEDEAISIQESCIAKIKEKAENFRASRSRFRTVSARQHAQRLLSMSPSHFPHSPIFHRSRSRSTAPRSGSNDSRKRDLSPNPADTPASKKPLTSSKLVQPKPIPKNT